MKHCIRCLNPDTRPDLSFDQEGMCDACRSAEKKEKIDWEARGEELDGILDRYRKNNGNYDCIIPVSGGKDSTFQVIKMLEKGMHPLAVTFAQCGVTPEGQHNLDNIAELGVDHIIIRPNRKIYKQLFAESFKKLGDPCWPCHVGIFTVPIKIAVQYKIPLIIWGENSQMEYGGPAKARESNILDTNWLQEFGGMQGMRVEDWAKHGIPIKDLYWYVYPSDDEIKQVGVTGLFLGYYHKWNAREQLKIVERNGFKRLPYRKRGAKLDYENVDCKFVDFHDYLMWLKYGFGRTTTQVNIDIRNKRLSREIAQLQVDMWDGEKPELEEFSQFTGLPKEEIENVFKNFSRDN